LGVKRPGCEADHLPPSSAEAKEWVELYFHSLRTPSWRGDQLKHGNNYTFTLYATHDWTLIVILWHATIWESRGTPYSPAIQQWLLNVKRDLGVSFCVEETLSSYLVRRKTCLWRYTPQDGN
jgi:hypothetical protein